MTYTSTNEALKALNNEKEEAGLSCALEEGTSPELTKGDVTRASEARPACRIRRTHALELKTRAARRTTRPLLSWRERRRWSCQVAIVWPLDLGDGTGQLAVPDAYII